MDGSGGCHPELGNPNTEELAQYVLTDKWILAQKLRIHKKTLNPSVHIIHYMEGTLLADSSDGILLQAFALLIQQALNFRNSCCSRKRFKGDIFFNIWGFCDILNKL